MLQLIITIVSLAILSLAWLPHVGAKLPEEQKAQDSAVLVEKALPQFQRAYQVLTEAAEGEPPIAAPGTSNSMAAFNELLRIPPKAPPGFEWQYGRHPADGSARAGRDYVCAVSGTAGRGAWDALQQVVGFAGHEDLVLGYACAEAVSLPLQEFPANAAVTLYLTYEAPEEATSPETPSEAGEGETQPPASPDVPAEPT